MADSKDPTPSPWTDFDRGDQTEQTKADFSKSVRNYLREEGHIGYALGEPKILNLALINVCILDPEEAEPKRLLIFAKNIRGYIPSSTVSPLSDTDFSKTYNQKLEEYDLTFSFKEEDQQRDFIGQCDRRGDITSIEEIH